MQRGTGENGWRRWAALAIPGLSASVGWAATSGWAPIYRFLWGVAVGLAVYALVHFLFESAGRRK